MKLHIPKHFERFEVISQLKQMLLEYSKTGILNTETNSFEDYLYSSSLDSVKKFLMLCISKDSIGEADYDNIIDYYTTKFFSFRGTLKVFELLDDIKDILGITIKSYEYTTTSLTIDYDVIETGDINLFVSSATEFFKALLYFQGYIDFIATLKLNLEVDSEFSLSGGAVSYTNYKVEEVYNEDN